MWWGRDQRERNIPLQDAKGGTPEGVSCQPVCPFTIIIEDLISTGGAVRLNLRTEGANWWVAWKTHRFCELGGKMVDRNIQISRRPNGQRLLLSVRQIGICLTASYYHML